MLSEQVEQDSRARWVVLAAVIASGGKAEEVTPHESRDRLERWLDGETKAPEGMDAEQWELRQSLGVA